LWAADRADIATNNMKLANLTYTVNKIRKHPLTRDHKWNALKRYLKWQVGSRLVPGKVAVDWIKPSKLLLAPGMWGSTMNLYVGLQDFEQMAFLLHLLRPESLFVDAGANVGIYTILSSAVVGARSIAIEPVPTTYTNLLDNLRVNAIADKVTPLNVGLAENKGTLQFSSRDDTRNRVLVGGHANGTSIQVPVMSLDDVLDGKEPTAIKMDVEGYETAVFAGATKALANKSLLALVVELNGHGAAYGYDESLLRRRLVEAGFQACRYDPLQRQLRSSDSDREPTGNTIYIRKTQENEIADRLTQAPRFALWDISL
jgi:FkbM family methyltransferase